MSFRLPWALALATVLATVLVTVLVLLDVPATAEFSSVRTDQSHRSETQWSERGDASGYIEALISASAQARIAEDAAATQALLQAASKQEAAPRASQPQSPASFDYPASCDGHPVPAYILWSESHCNYGAVNPTGCGGYSCVGMYQFDLRHWQEGGGCAWLGDWTVPANQEACANQMSRGGTDLSAWGG